VLHRAAYAALGLTGWRYDAIDCDEQGLPGLLDSLGPEWAGLSVTMPLKRAALAAADVVSPLARDVGAANTLVLSERGRRAENTDVAGIVAALREAGVTGVRHGVVLGAGGTAQAALAALGELGERQPQVFVRDPARAGELRAAAERLGLQPSIHQGLDNDVVYQADVVISTLPPGAADRLARDAWRNTVVLLDVVYAPWPTPFAASAAAAGCTVVSGLAMLLHQAAAQAHLMTGRPAPVDAMRAALQRAVAARR
jgi:shikimate dehydrogenase